MKNKVVRILEDRITFDTRRKVKKLIKGVNGKILDLGCGDRGSFDYGELKVIGADRVKNRITKKAYKRVIADAEKRLPFKNREFGAVVFSGVIQYLVNYKDSLEEINRILKHDGALILTTVNRNSLLRVLRVIGKEPKRGAGEHNIFSEYELRRLLQANSFQVIRVIGADFMWVPKSLSSNIILIAVKGD